MHSPLNELRRLHPDPSSGPGLSVPSEPALEGFHPALEPLLRQFAVISRIPRPSGQETAVTEYLVALAEQHGWRNQVDAGGNLVIYVPGKGKGMGAEPLALQSHLDMVCEPETHDFSAEPIQFGRERRTIKGEMVDLLTARGTSLGADNGIGVATALALAMKEDIHHPPLELVFTVGEEIGLKGAFALDPKLISARCMLNLDSEDLGEVFISSAGARQMDALWEIQRVKPISGTLPLRIRLFDMPGGHSGTDIDAGQGNPLVLLADTAAVLKTQFEQFQFAGITGGSKMNAIPADGEMVLWLNRGPGVFESVMSQLASAVRSRGIDPSKMSIKVQWGEAESDMPWPIEERRAQGILMAFRFVSHGVVAMSQSVRGLVETSNNLAVARMEGNSLRVITFARSSKAGAMKALQDQIRGTLELTGASVVLEAEVPGWETDPNSPLVRKALEAFERATGTQAKTAGIHAGLECGILAGRIPDLQVISVGPTIVNPHCPQEGLAIKTLEPFWRFITALAEDLC